MKRGRPAASCPGTPTWRLGEGAKDSAWPGITHVSQRMSAESDVRLPTGELSLLVYVR